MDLGLEGRRALVTAASKGLGRGCAAALAAEGARVFIAARGAEQLERTAKEIGAAGHLAADVSRPEDVQRILDAALEALGGLDILVVNAGGPPPGTFESTPVEDWETGYRLTLMSAVRLIKGALPLLRESGQGRVVYVGSTSVREPIANIVQSNAYRSAVVAMLKTVAGEVAGQGITVNALSPGRFDTDRIRQIDSAVAQREGVTREDVTQRSIRSIPAGRLGTPDEFGAVCAFLCSRQAGYLTGQNILLDGGASKGVY